MSGCGKNRKNTKCGAPGVTQEPSKLSVAVRFCLAFGRYVTWDGANLNVRGNPTIADGWYSQVLVKDGCVVDARVADEPIYVPPPCAPSPGSCGGEGGGGGGSTKVPLYPDPCNLLNYEGDALNAQLFFGKSSGIKISGCGTELDPLTFSVEQDTSPVYLSTETPDIIDVEGAGTAGDPFTVSHKQRIQQGTYGPFTVDRYGHITAYSEEAAQDETVSAVTPGIGIDASIERGMLNVALARVANPVEGQYQLGGYNTSVDAYGRVTAVAQTINLDVAEEQEYDFGLYFVRLNALGSITSIRQRPTTTDVDPDEFVYSFRGSNNNPDIEREMSYTASFSGPTKIEYRGFLGKIARLPGTYQNTGGVRLAVDGVLVPEIMIEVSGVYGDDLTQNYISCVRGVTDKSLSADSHTITIRTTSTQITRYDAFVSAKIVGRGIV